MKTLHLNLKKKWFDMIYAGLKPEEYRELTKYWAKRLMKIHNFKYIEGMENFMADNKIFFKEFDTVTFSNGYAKNRKQFIIEFIKTEISTGKEKYGAVKGKKYFCIKLGKILNSNF